MVSSRGQDRYSGVSDAIVKILSTVNVPSCTFILKVNTIKQQHTWENEIMITIEEMGRGPTFFEQMETKGGGPVSVINKISVIPEEADDLVRHWTTDFEIMRQQPGYISMQLYGGIGKSGVFLNCSVWESVEDLKRAFERSEFQATLQDYPPSAVASPHIFEKMAIPGCCVA